MSLSVVAYCTLLLAQPMVVWGKRYGRRRSGCDTEECRETVLGITLGVFCLFLCLVLYAFVRVQMNRNKPEKKTFRGLTQEADRYVVASARIPVANDGQEPILGFAQAEYTTLYCEPDPQSEEGSKETQTPGTGELMLLDLEPPEDNCKSVVILTGSGPNGYFSAVGKVAIYTGKAYWIEKLKDASTSSTVEKRLVRGFFRRDPCSNSLSFEGHFEREYGCDGDLAEFVLIPKGRVSSESPGLNLIGNATDDPNHSSPSPSIFQQSSPPGNSSAQPSFVAAQTHQSPSVASSAYPVPASGPPNNSNVPSIFRS